MSQQKHKYYPNRQIITMPLVQPEEYTERVILCIPAFAWRVARAYLSRQAQWRSTYAASFFDSYYLSPTDEDMDIIKASLDAALAEDDMSCDITQALEDLGIALTGQMSDDNAAIVTQLAALVRKECGPGCGGSGGAGATEAPPNGFDDDGINYPDGFDDYTQYNSWKCAMSKLIVDRIMQDLDWIKDLAITEISTSVLAGVLLTPIPLDDLGLFAAFITTWIIEIALDGLITEVLTEIGLDYDTLLCTLYESLNTEGAMLALDDWADDNLTETARILFGFFVNADNLNLLFEDSNTIVPSNDCSACGITDPWVVDFGTLTDGSLAPDTTFFEITSAYSTNGGCNRWQAQFTSPPGVDWSVSLVKAGAGSPIECVATPENVHAAYWDAVLDVWTTRRYTDPIEGETLCIKGGETVFSRYDDQYILQVTVNGTC